MPTWIYFALVVAALATVSSVLRRRRHAKALAELVANAFIVKPYLQLGNSPTQSTSLESVEIHWISDQVLSGWQVEYRNVGTSWQSGTRVTPYSAGYFADKGATHWRTTIKNLIAGSEFEYRVLLDKNVVFTAVGKCRMPAGKPFRAAIYGDLANGSPASRQIAHRVAMLMPDLVVLAGDITYNHGLMSEYLRFFWPVYNADATAPDVGGPIMRSRLVLATAGNHDMAIKEVGETGDLRKSADAGAFFVLWSQPLNGPLGRDAVRNVPRFVGNAELLRPLLDASGDRFPRMANFSVDYGDSHWLFLDANWYMDWSDPGLRAWVDADLAAAADKPWKFVVLHQPPFTTDVKHADEQRMRLLADLFEKHGVAVVFGGHNHTYERNHPLKFKVTPREDGKPTDSRGRVAGTFEFDRAWDGKTVTRMNGVLYLVTGGGGAKMYIDLSRRADHDNLPPWTAKLIDDVHSLTVMDLERDRLTFRQLAADGRELDSFVITK